MSPTEIPVTRRPSTPLPIGTGPDEPSGVIEQRGYGPQPDKVISVDVEGCASVPDVVIEKKEDADRRLAEENERRARENERDVLQDLFRDEVDFAEVEAVLTGAAEGEEEEEDDDAAQPG